MHLAQVVTSLYDEAKGEQTENSRPYYLQAIASLSDDALEWVVVRFGTLPADL